MSEKNQTTCVGSFERVIPPKLVDLMREEYEDLLDEDYMEASIGPADDAVVDHKVRSTKIAWWSSGHWVSSIFHHYFNKFNDDIWEYDIRQVESIQVTSYGEGDYYGWHCDYGTTDYEPGLTRKLSASLLISDPSEYEGGDFEIIDYHGQVLTLPKLKGTIIIFDSRAPHRVTPVTKGKRVSLVSWMLGPKLK
jgi:Rps23 Pro-64 3,4-dihydroxylase Tpa1-like proline 4-hydroxylase